jgi:sterol 3beta-glucosyltransferase
VKVLLLTYGSRGDVQPYIALGKQLLADGHEVVLATSDRFENSIREHGLKYGFMRDDMLKLLDSDDGRALVEKTSNILGVVIQLVAMLKKVGPLQRALVEDCWQVCDLEKPDLIVYHPKTYAAPDIGEKLGIPVVLSMLAPMMVPTAERVNIGFPDLGLGGWYNRLTYRIVNGIMSVSSAKFRKELRAQLNLPSKPKPDLLHAADGTRVPVVHAHSRHVVPQPSDWPTEAVTTGYWFLDEVDCWTPPEQLEAFLRDGPPPVYIGFGSMAGRKPDKLAKIVVDAIQQSGERAILATGWGGLRPADLPCNILSIEGAPHDWLFPRVSCVVHHGGAGTTAAGLRAGKPTLVIPFMGDQPFWAKRVFEIGVGPNPIPRRKLKATKLADALRQLTKNPSISANSETIGVLIRQENGPATASCILQQIQRRGTK